MTNPIDLTSTLRLVIPDGSMQKVVAGWLEKAGILVYLPNNRLKTGNTNVSFVESITYMRPQEIPLYLAQGFFHIAIANEDWIANWQADVLELAKIPIGRAMSQAVKIVLAVSKDSNYKSVSDLPNGSMIASEYVELVQKYLIKKRREDIQIIRSYGGTEQKVNYGATAIVDITETGSSLTANGLVVIDEIMVSNTIVAANRQAYSNPLFRPLIDWFVAVIKGVVEGEKYILLQANVPEKELAKAVKVIGGMKSPTINSLAIAGWYEISSYIKKSHQHEIIIQLLHLGVKDICVSDCVSIVMGA